MEFSASASYSPFLTEDILSAPKKKDGLMTNSALQAVRERDPLRDDPVSLTKQESIDDSQGFVSIPETDGLNHQDTINQPEALTDVPSQGALETVREPASLGFSELESTLNIVRDKILIPAARGFRALYTLSQRLRREPDLLEDLVRIRWTCVSL